MTADELLKLRLPDKRTELVRGKLVVREPAGARHGSVAMRLGVILGAYVPERNLGLVLAAETGFKLPGEPQTVRAPDVGFVRAERVPARVPVGYFDGAPDLAVEVLSPDDRPSEVGDKVSDWLAAGAGLVWVIDPGSRRTLVHRADGTRSRLTDRDALEGETVVPGFTCLLREIF